MKIFAGIVVSTKMPKTATVEVERFLSHPVYKKRFKRSRKYQVHTEIEVKVGDRVKFADTRPISKTKKWIIIEDIKVKKVTETRKEEIKIKTTKSKAVKTKVVRKKGKNGTA